MKEKLQQIREKAIAEIEGSDGLDRLNEVRQAVLGKKGELTAVLKGMKDVAPEDRRRSDSGSTTPAPPLRRSWKRR